MQYKMFGKTDEKVSVVGYGNMRLPVVNGDYSHIDVPEAMRLVRYTGMGADRCVGCGRCDSTCPQGLDIPGHLRKVARYFAANRNKKAV